MLKNRLEFILSSANNIVVFNLSFVLLLAKVNFILEKQNCKKGTSIVYNTSYIKKIFILLIKVLVFYIQVLIISVRILSFKKFITKYKIS